MKGRRIVRIGRRTKLDGTAQSAYSGRGTSSVDSPDRSLMKSKRKKAGDG